jgi:hypothetical protein
MEITIDLNSLKNSKLVTFKSSEEIQICPQCDGWWKDGDFPKHNMDCTKIQEGP